MKQSAVSNISIRLCLVALFVVGGTTVADAQFIGTLNQRDSWSLEFLGLGAVNTAYVTVTYIDSRGRQEVDLFTIPVGSGVITLVYDKASIGNNVRRIILDIDFPIYIQLGTEMSIWQGPERPSAPPWKFPVVSEGTPRRYVFNVATAP